MLNKEVSIHTKTWGDLRGILAVPSEARGIVLFAHGSGSGRLSPRNQMVARKFQELNLATLLMDLLTEREEAIDERTREYRFDIELLTKRLIEVTHWVQNQPGTKNLNVGYFGASTGAAAALKAAGREGDVIKAVVSRGGRPDLAEKELEKVTAPTLLIIGERDRDVIELNKKAYNVMNACKKEMKIVPRATHLFEEPGTLEEVSKLSSQWFIDHLSGTHSSSKDSVS